MLDIPQRVAAAAAAPAWRRARGMSLPLQGIRVLDLSRLLPGGFCSLLLADFGADVLKVEDTGMGDYIRWSPPYYEGAHESARSALFLSLNRNKRSIRLDLKNERGREALLRARARIRRRARVLPPGRARSPRRRLRADARGEPGDRLLRDLRLRPGRSQTRRLGARHELPRPDRAARADRRARRRARAGRRADRRSRRRRADGGVRHPRGAARARRRRSGLGLAGSGEGQLVDVSMADGALSWLAMVAATLLRRRRRPAPRRAAAGGLADLLPPVRVRRRLGHAGRARAEVLAGLLPRRRARGPDRARSSSGPGSAAHEQVQEIFKARTREQWEAFAREHDCCLEPVLELDEALGSELVRRARDGRRDRAARSRAPRAPARRAGQARPHAGRSQRACRARRWASTPRRCCWRPATARRRSPSCSPSGAAAGAGRRARRASLPGADGARRRRDETPPRC